MWRQMKFLDEEGNVNGGFIKIDGDTGEILEAVCGCCGGALELGEIWKILEIYEYWVNLTEIII